MPTPITAECAALACLLWWPPLLASHSIKISLTNIVNLWVNSEIFSSDQQPPLWPNMTTLAQTPQAIVRVHTFCLVFWFGLLRIVKCFFLLSWWQASHVRFLCQVCPDTVIELGYPIRMLWFGQFYPHSLYIVYDRAARLWSLALAHDWVAFLRLYQFDFYQMQSTVHVLGTSDRETELENQIWYTDTKYSGF